MWLIVGLGNPGPQYALTRHNIGFLCLDLLEKGLNGSGWNTEHKAQVSRVKWTSEKNIPENVILVKPQTYMNRSGESVQAIMHFYKIPQDHVIVAHDDIDQAFGSMKFHKNRGHGGHNGIRNISELLGNADYLRLKLGVGRPPHPEMQVADYVLQKFSQEEQNHLTDFLNKAGDAVEVAIFEGLGKASTLFNK
jgi:PTH1 family peptidyl-tRNA hydrolase